MEYLETGSSGSRQETPLVMVVMSIVFVIAWAVFILLYALFLSTGFTLFQNIIVAIVSLIITGLVMGLVWVVWESRRKKAGA